MRVIRWCIGSVIAITLIPLILVLTLCNQPTDTKITGLTKPSTFIDQVYDCYLKTDQKIKPSLVLAQAVLESGNGLNEKAQKNHNYFGIMQNRKLKKFNSMQENVNYYCRLLSSKTYQLQNVDWGKKMKKALAIYSTGFNYYESLIKVRDSYNLLAYDNPDSKFLAQQKIKININQNCYQTKLNPYTANYYGQCTWFAWGRVYELYRIDSGMHGNGKECVQELLQRNKTFQLVNSLDDVKHKAVFSTSSGSIYGHVGIIEQVDHQRDKLIVSEGNFNGYLYKVNIYNRKAFIKKYGIGLKIAIKK